MDQDLKISVVVPVYNSAQGLSDLVSRINRVLTVYGEPFEIILVDDGSKDDSWRVLTGLKKEAPDTLTAIRLDKNFGQHKAIICGLNFSRGEVVITMDDDGQHPPEEIPKLLDRYKETNADVVYGLYERTGHSKGRSFGSSLVKGTAKYFGENEEYDGSSFRLFTREIVDKLKTHHQTFMYIDEVIHWFTPDIQGVRVEHHPREVGKSQYNFFKLASMYFSILINYSAWPLRFMTYGGIILSLISFILGIFFIIKRFVFGSSVEGFTAIIVTILFSTSLMLICFGIIGQYLYKLHQTQSGKPSYKVKKVL